MRKGPAAPLWVPRSQRWTIVDRQWGTLPGLQAPTLSWPGQGPSNAVTAEISQASWRATTSPFPTEFISHLWLSAPHLLPQEKQRIHSFLQSHEMQRMFQAPVSGLPSPHPPLPPATVLPGFSSRRGPLPEGHAPGLSSWAEALPSRKAPGFPSPAVAFLPSLRQLLGPGLCDHDKKGGD